MIQVMYLISDVPYCESYKCVSNPESEGSIPCSWMEILSIKFSGSSIYGNIDSGCCWHLV